MLYSLLIPYMVVIVIIIVFLGYKYKVSVDNEYEKYIEDKYNLIHKIDTEINYLMSNIEELIVKIDLNDKFKRIISVEEEHRTGTENYQISQAVKELKKFSGYNHCIEDVILYYRTGDFFLVNSSIRTERGVYKDYKSNISIPYEAWEGTLTQSYPMGKWVKEGDSLFYISTEPFNEPTEFINVIIKIDTTKFNEIINEYTALNQGTLYVLSQEIMQVGTNKPDNAIVIDQDTQQEIREIMQDESVKSKTINVQGTLYRVLYLENKVLDLEYIWLVENSKLGQQAVYVTSTFGAMMIICLLVLAIGIYVIKENHNKIMSVIERLNKKNPDLIENEYSEIGYIHTALNRIENKIEQQEKIVIENSIGKALYGVLEEKQLPLYNNQNMIVIWEELKNNRQAIQERELKLFIIENILGDIFEEGIKIWVMPVDDWQVVVINWQQEQGYEVEYIMDNLEKARKFLLEQLEIAYTVGISSPISGINNFSAGYKEAIQAIQEKQVIGDNQIIYYGNIVEHCQQYEYTEAMSNQLMNYIRLGECVKAQEFVNIIYWNYFEEKKISVEFGKLLIIDLITTVRKIASDMSMEIRLEATEVLKEGYMPYEIKQKIDEEMIRLCQQGVENKANTETRKEKIFKYIEDNYKDPHLNVTMVAEEFELNPSYLSRFFKEHTGENLLNYINSYRLKKAKELIIHSNKNLLNICLETGFLNGPALTRAFKKNEGITPSEYKAMYKVETEKNKKQCQYREEEK